MDICPYRSNDSFPGNLHCQIDVWNPWKKRLSQDKQLGVNFLSHLFIYRQKKTALPRQSFSIRFYHTTLFYWLIFKKQIFRHFLTNVNKLSFSSTLGDDFHESYLVSDKLTFIIFMTICHSEELATKNLEWVHK